MNITAEIKYLHISPKKMKALARIVVGLSSTDAIDRLLLVSGKGARLLLSAIKSAHASAKNNLKLDENKLKIKTVEVLKGPALRRWQPVSRGMAHSIKKRMTHLKVTLEENTNVILRRKPKDPNRFQNHEGDSSLRSE